MAFNANVSVYQLALQLVADPRSAYLHPTDLLERAVAILRALYGGGPEERHHAAIRAAEDWTSAVLQARRRLDRDREREAALVAALQADVPPAPKPPPPDRGWRVKAKRPQPILPDAGAVRDDYANKRDPFA